MRSGAVRSLVNKTHFIFARAEKENREDSVHSRRAHTFSMIYSIPFWCLPFCECLSISVVGTHICNYSLNRSSREMTSKSDKTNLQNTRFLIGSAQQLANVHRPPFSLPRNLYRRATCKFIIDDDDDEPIHRLTKCWCK